MKFTDKKLNKDQALTIGLFKNHTTLEKTLNELKDIGIWSENIAILMSKPADQKDENYKLAVSEVATTGLITGIATGGILGWLASLDTFLIPSIGLLVAAGPLASALTGIAIGGSIGSLGAVFINMGISKFESRKLEKFIRDKGVIVSVHIEDSRELLMVKNIFVTNGAVKVYNPLMEKKTSKINAKKYFNLEFKEEVNNLRHS